MNVMLVIKYSSTIMQGKRKLCECHTRFFKLSCYILYIIYAARKKVGDCFIMFFKLFTLQLHYIYIKRKCDGHIILVYYVCVLYIDFKRKVFIILQQNFTYLFLCMSKHIFKFSTFDNFLFLFECAYFDYSSIEITTF